MSSFNTRESSSSEKETSYLHISVRHKIVNKYWVGELTLYSIVLSTFAVK